MIAFLSGRVANIDRSFIELDVENVGYEVELPLSDIVKLAVNQEIKIFTHLVVRDDAHLLFGFLDVSVRNCFRQLIKVSGIGAKTALMILSQLSLPELQSAVDDKDIAVLSSVPGIGKKTAERILVELADKILYQGKVMLNIASSGQHNSDIHTNKLIKSELSQVLEQFGYNAKKVDKIIKDLPDHITDTADAVKWALQQM
jgi:Holliday junction DNA helicase RuvA